MATDDAQTAKVEIYTRDWCGFCTAAKNLLDETGVPYTEYNASKERSHRDAMIARSGRATFPQVFVAGEHVGGCDDLFAAKKSGRLDQLLTGTVTS